MGDFDYPTRERLRRLSGDETRAKVPGRTSALAPNRAAAGGTAGKQTLAESWSGEPASARRGADPAACTVALASAHRQLAMLRTANAAADHYASSDAAQQLHLALESAQQVAAADQRSEVEQLATEAAPLLAAAFTPGRAAIDEALAGTGERAHWNRDVTAWREARDRAWSAAAAPFAAQLGIAAEIRVDDAAAAHGARGLAHGGVVHLLPSLAPDGADALHILAHELVHVAQSRLPTAGALADAEHEANTLAAGLVRGTLLHQPRIGLAAGVAAADTGTTLDAQHGLRPVPAHSPLAASADEPTLEQPPHAPWPVLAATGKPYQIVSAQNPVRFWAVSAWLRAGKGFHASGVHAVSPACATEIIAALGWVAPERIATAAQHVVFDLSRDVTASEVAASAFYYLGLPSAQPVVSRASGEIVQVATPLAAQDVPPGTRITPDDAMRLQVVRALAAFTGLTPIDGAVDQLRRDPRFAESVVQSGVVLWNISAETGNSVFGFDETSDSTGPYTRWLHGKHGKTPHKPDDGGKLKLDHFYGTPIPAHFAASPVIAEAGHPVWLGLEVQWPKAVPDLDKYEHVDMVTAGHRHQPVALAQCNWIIQLAGGGAAGVSVANTDLAELEHVFVLPPGRDHATYTVTASASFPEFFTAASFSTTVEVKSTAAYMKELQAAAFADLETTDETAAPETFDVTGSGEDTHGLRTTGTLPPWFGLTKWLDPHAAERSANRERLEATRMYLEAHGASPTALAAVDHELTRESATDAALASDNDKQWRPFQVRGTYLSREEGIPSGALVLYGAVRVSAGAISVQIRDLSRRFGADDLQFTGYGLTFEAALKAAFTDEAKSYPAGLLAIDVEEIEAHAFPVAKLGDSTGTTIGFQLGTSSTWRRVKAKVFDPTVSFVVNTAGMIAMGIFPPSAVVVAPLLAVYNSAATLDRMHTQATQGTLTLGTAATSVGEIALNVLPMAGSAKAFTTGWFLLEGANWGGQAVLMTSAALQQARSLQANDVAELSRMYEELQRLEASKADPAGVEDARRKLMARAKLTSERIEQAFAEQIEQNGLFAVSGAVVHRALSMPEGGRVGELENFANAFDHHAVAERVPGATYEHDGSFHMTGADHRELTVTVKRTDGPARVVRDGDRAVIEVPHGMTAAEAADLVAENLKSLRAAGETEAPATVGPLNTSSSVEDGSLATQHEAAGTTTAPPTVRHVLVDHVILTNVGALPAEMLFGAQQQAEATHALTNMSAEDYAEMHVLIHTVRNPVAAGFLYKALAAHNPIADIQWLAGAITGRDANWMVDNLTLGDPRGVGGGLQQQWQMSCNAAMTLTIRGNYDPVFALRLREANVDISRVDNNDPTTINANQAALERQMLESQYGGRHPNGARGVGGDATPHSSTALANGRYADDLLNAQSNRTGLNYTSLPNPTGAQVVAILEQSLSAQMEVPLVIGDARNADRHYVVAQARRVVGGHVEYNIHDPGNSQTSWVRADDIANGTMPGGYSRVGTVEVPALARVPTTSTP